MPSSLSPFETSAQHDSSATADALSANTVPSFTESGAKNVTPDDDTSRTSIPIVSKGVCSDRYNPEELFYP